jgi:putative addiction module component (TIGR02574 family)
MTIDQLERVLLKLPAHERARLAERLISSLDEESEVEQAWYDEAERRLEEIQAGSVREVSTDEVYTALGLDEEQ